MSKFEMVRKALWEKTRDTDNSIGVTKNVDCRHKGCKYAIYNVVTNNVYDEGYKTLDEIINKYDLTI